MSAIELFATTPGGQRLDLQRTSDFQAALLGMAGHDLRQPLQIIQSTYELLQTRDRTESEQTWLEHGQRAISGLTEQLDRWWTRFVSTCTPRRWR